MKKLPVLLMALSLLVSFSLMAQSGKKTYDLSGFNSIALGVSVDVHIMQGDYKVAVTGPAKAIEQLEIATNKESLAIGTNKKAKGMKWKSEDVDVFVTMPSIKNLSIGGSGDIIMEDAFENQGDMNVSIGGSGDVKLQGSAKMVSINVAGNGDVDAENLKSASCEISIAGSGDVTIGPSKELDVSIAGNGDVKYKGEPKIRKSIVGKGDVNKM